VKFFSALSYQASPFEPANLTQLPGTGVDYSHVGEQNSHPFGLEDKATCSQSEKEIEGDSNNNNNNNAQADNRDNSC